MAGVYLQHLKAKYANKILLENKNKVRYIILKMQTNYWFLLPNLAGKHRIYM